MSDACWKMFGHVDEQAAVLDYLQVLNFKASIFPFSINAFSVCSSATFLHHIGPIFISRNMSGNNSMHMPHQNVYVQPSPRALVMRSIMETRIAAKEQRTRFVQAVTPELRVCKISMLSVIVVLRIPIDVQPRNTARTSATTVDELNCRHQPYARTQPIKSVR